MFDRFKSVSFSFEQVPLKLREKVALDDLTTLNLLRYLKEFTEIREALVLSTCNRTEIYYSSETDLSLEMIKLLGVQKQIPDPTSLFHYSEIHSDHAGAVNRLFEVSLGLHSMILGDLQISHQVKRAYQMSVDEDMAGPFLHRLMHTIFFTNKKVVQETAFRDGAASVSYATLELVEELVQQVQTPKVLVIGLGEIGADVCRHLTKSSLKFDVTISNRTFSKAKNLAKECGFRAVQFEGIPKLLSKMDVVISSLTLDVPFITRSQVAHLEILSFKYFIDLSVPRSIEPEIENIPGVLVYNIDHLQTKTSQSLEKRRAAIPEVKQILAQSITEFSEWSKAMQISPVINNLKNALEKIRQEEIARVLKKRKNLDLDAVERITRNIIQRIIKRPAVTLKSACKRDQADLLLEGLTDLFDLEKETHPNTDH